MYLNSRFKHQQGSMLVVALFIIIVISLLAASLAKILGSSADGIANEVYSAKAIYAAESGMENVIYKVVQENICLLNSTMSLAAITGLENCKVNMQCTEIELKDGSNESLYYLQSAGSCEGGRFVAEHKVEAEVKL